MKQLNRNLEKLIEMQKELEKTNSDPNVEMPIKIDENTVLPTEKIYEY